MPFSEEVIRIVIRESLGLIIAAGAIWMWRRDTKANATKLLDTVDAYIRYGERAADREVKFTMALERITSALENIESRFEKTMICPVSGVTTEDLRRIRDVGATRTVSQRELVGAIREVLAAKDDDDGGGYPGA